jgi:hypothetical protein
MNYLPDNFIERYGQDLLEFLYKSYRYRYKVSGMSEDDTPVDNKPSFVYPDDDSETWHYEDRFYGSNPFGGNIQIIFQDTVCFYMDVQGKSFTSDPEIQASIDECLFEALMRAPKQYPFRGISAYTSAAGLFYSCIGHGNIGPGTTNHIYGQETIRDRDGNLLHEVSFCGRIININ